MQTSARDACRDVTDGLLNMEKVPVVVKDDYSEVLQLVENRRVAKNDSKAFVREADTIQAQASQVRFDHSGFRRRCEAWVQNAWLQVVFIPISQLYQDVRLGSWATKAQLSEGGVVAMDDI